MKTLADIEKFLQVGGWGGSDKNAFTLVCNSEFEPHGRASESWDVIYRLTLPTVPSFWKSTTGWRPCTKQNGATFSSRTLDGVVAKAVQYLEETKAIPASTGEG